MKLGFLSGRRVDRHDPYIEGVLIYMRKRDFSDDVVLWMESKLRDAVNERRPLSEMETRELWYLARIFDEELNLKHGRFGMSHNQYMELTHLFMDAIDIFSSHKLGHAHRGRHHLD
ncbi:MAG: hypothetical protein AB1529_03400 [Candidatus Micrarchaeota archaeon]